MSRPPAPAPAQFYRAQGYDPRTSVGLLMRKSVQSMAHLAEREMASSGLTMAQWGPLALIDRGLATTVAELARELSIDPGAMTRTIQRLEDKGLCQRQTSTQDRRQIQLTVTAAGKAAIDGVGKALAHVNNAHLAGFSRDEWLLFLSFLERFLANGQASASSSPP